MPQWEYRVIHINLDGGHPPQPPDPQVASERLGGVLSPEFIAREFPEQYKAAPLPRHPAEQLQYFLNLLGKDGWELVETGQVGPDAQLRLHEDTLKVLAVGRQTMAMQLNERLQSIESLPDE